MASGGSLFIPLFLAASFGATPILHAKAIASCTWPLGSDTQVSFLAADAACGDEITAHAELNVSDFRFFAMLTTDGRGATPITGSAELDWSFVVVDGPEHGTLGFRSEGGGSGSHYGNGGAWGVVTETTPGTGLCLYTDKPAIPTPTSEPCGDYVNSVIPYTRGEVIDMDIGVWGHAIPEDGHGLTGSFTAYADLVGPYVMDQDGVMHPSTRIEVTPEPAASFLVPAVLCALLAVARRRSGAAYSSRRAASGSTRAARGVRPGESSVVV